MSARRAGPRPFKGAGSNFQAPPQHQGWAGLLKLAINLKTVKALGLLTIPQSLLLWADPGDRVKTKEASCEIALAGSQTRAYGL